MKKIMTPTAGIVSLWLMLACSNAFGQGESQGSADTKTAATVRDSAKGVVEVKLTEYKIEMPASVSAGATTFKVLTKCIARSLATRGAACLLI
jgi:hypothetical protein